MVRGVIDRDLGYARILQQMDSLDGKEILIGLHNDGSSKEGIAVAHYGAINEFGGENVPERSFIRSTFDEQVMNINNLVVRVVRGVQDSKLSWRQAGGIIGEIFQRNIQDKIRSNVPPPNAPSTIERKGSSRTLIDTGLMVANVRYTFSSRGSGAGLRNLARKVARLRS